MSEYSRRVAQHKHPIGGRLEHLTIELSERCNNACIHCCINRPVNDHAAQARELSTAQVQGILRQAAGLGCLQVHFTGGEPLLRPDFEELYLAARRLGMKVLLFTNARLLTPRLAALFARMPPGVDIEVTVYGMHQESYEAAARAPGAFAQFQQGLALLRAQGVAFRVKCALLPPNRAEMDEFEAGPPDQPWKLVQPTYSLAFDLRSRRDDPAKNQQIAALRLPPQEAIAVVLRDSGRYHPWTWAQRNERLRPPGDTLFSCGAPTGKTACVDACGRLQACMGLRLPEWTVDLVGASEAAVPLGEALERFAALGQLRATHPEYLRRCARCAIKAICEQCPAKSWTEHGTLDTPVAYLCDMAHTWARHLGWLKDDEFGWEVREWREPARPADLASVPPTPATVKHGPEILTI